MTTNAVLRTLIGSVIALLKVPALSFTRSAYQLHYAVHVEMCRPYISAGH